MKGDFGENVAWWITVMYLHKKIIDSVVFVRYRYSERMNVYSFSGGN